MSDSSINVENARPGRWSRFKGWCSRMAAAAAPSRAAWIGASIGASLSVILVWGWALSDVVNAVNVAFPLLVAGTALLAAVLTSGLAILLLAIARRMPLHFRWIAASSFLMVALTCTWMPAAIGWQLTAAVSLILVAAVLGGAAAVVSSGQWRRSNTLGRIGTIVLGVAGMAAVGAFGFWLLRDGTARAELENELRSTSTAVTPIAAGDPSSPGKFAVKMLTYGSGDDPHRSEFAEGVAIKTAPIDGSHVLEGWDGVTGWARTRFWGFDEKRLPINGRVWYPEGDGPFPLVLIVHGNHLSSDFSDPGYEYLGVLLASRGYIFVSVDENFLNSMETDIIGGLDSENNARGWMLLEHLRVWHAWNKDEKNPFYGKVDTARIALVGHSRGGEAVAHAAAFNRLKYNPDDAKARFDYGYDIKSVVAIEPADGQYRPAGLMTPLADINYFTIQGAHDSDVSSFMGLKQYDRVKFSGEGDWLKSAVYVYGANHGQFNTTWGAYDVSIGLGKHLINTRALMDAETQRRVLEIYLSAFLDCTLGDVREYRQLFRDARAGAAWLPKTVYVTEYADATFEQLATFDEDIDLTTGTLAGSQIESENLTRWREQRLKLRMGPNEDRSVVIGWDREKQQGEPSYRITWPVEKLQLASDSVLSFSLADGNEDPSPDEDEEEGESEKSDEPKEEDEEEDVDEPIDFTVELTDAAGQKATLPLSHFALLRPQIETMFLKSESLHSGDLSEPVRQTFLFPLTDFQAANNQFDPTRVVQLRLVFDRTKSGVVVLDEVGFGKAP